MALVTALVVLSLTVAVIRSVDIPARLRAARVNAELAALVDGATGELVEEQVDVGPQLVRVRTGRRLHGPFLDIELDTVRLHLRLYHDARRTIADGSSITLLTGLTRVDGLGWVATFDGPRGPQRYLGWLVQRVAA